MVAKKKLTIPFSDLMFTVTHLREKGFNEFRFSIYEKDRRHILLGAWRRPKNKKRQEAV